MQQLRVGDAITRLKRCRSAVLHFCSCNQYAWITAEAFSYGLEFRSSNIAAIAESLDLFIRKNKYDSFALQKVNLQSITIYEYISIKDILLWPLRVAPQFMCYVTTETLRSRSNPVFGQELLLSKNWTSLSSFVRVKIKRCLLRVSL